jgi:hypothetical protein
MRRAASSPVPACRETCRPERAETEELWMADCRQVNSLVPPVEAVRASAVPCAQPGYLYGDLLHSAGVIQVVAIEGPVLQLAWHVARHAV